MCPSQIYSIGVQLAHAVRNLLLYPGLALRVAESLLLAMLEPLLGAPLLVVARVDFLEQVLANFRMDVGP